ncbi:MAG: hypothetical protein JKY53_12710 [Flavobacteriales bacterium]|nr:hypothetical protein [Flavobacteriales bacterium]
MISPIMQFKALSQKTKLIQHQISRLVQAEPKGITPEDTAMLEVLKKLTEDEKKAIKEVADSMVKPKEIKQAG